MAATYRVQGKYKDAELLSQRALAICERIQGPDHPEVAVKVNNLGIIYSDQGRYAEAEQLFRRAIEIREKAGEADHPWIAQSLSSLGALYSAQGKYVEAESLLKRAWAIGELGFGPTHPYVASYISNLAINYQRQSRYAEAEPLHLQAISIWESLGQEHLLLASTLMAYAALLRETKQESRALQLEARAREIQALILTKNMTDNKKGKQIGHSSKIRHNARRHSKERNLKSL